MSARPEQHRLLRRVLIAAQMVTLLVGLGVMASTVSRASGGLQIGFALNALVSIFRAGGFSLLSLRRCEGWFLMLAAYVLIFAQPGYKPVHVTELLLPMLRSGLYCAIPILGFFLWRLSDRGNGERRPALPLLTAIMLLVSATSIAFDTAVLGSATAGNDRLFHIAWRGSMLLGTILVALRRTAGWGLLLVPAAMFRFGEPIGMANLLLAGLNLAQWTLGHRAFRSFRISKASEPI